MDKNKQAVIDAITKVQKKEQKNVPVHIGGYNVPIKEGVTDTASADIKTEVKHQPRYVHVNEFPNRSQRRREARAGLETNNRKQTPGRRHQIEEIKTTQNTKFGPVTVGTGFFRRIVHKVVETKIWKSMINQKTTMFGKKGSNPAEK